MRFVYFHENVVPESLGLGKVKDTASVYGARYGAGLPGLPLTAELNFYSLIYRHCVFTKLTAISFIKTAKLISAM